MNGGMETNIDVALLSIMEKAWLGAERSADVPFEGELGFSISLFILRPLLFLDIMSGHGNFIVTGASLCVFCHSGVHTFDDLSRQ